MKELKGLLGKLSYIRRFIPRLASLTSAFAPLLKKNAKYKWTEEHQAAYLKIQNLVLRPPTIQPPKARKPLLICLATTANVIRALIAQEDEEGKEKPVYYVSRQHHDTEK